MVKQICIARKISRDQSYSLFSTTQEQLDFLRFPLGEIDKSETRSIAKVAFKCC